MLNKNRLYRFILFLLLLISNGGLYAAQILPLPSYISRTQKLVHPPKKKKAKKPNFSHNDNGILTTWNVNHGLNSMFIWEAIKDKQGRIWMGTEGNGVICFNESYFYDYGVQQGFKDATYYCVMEDHRGMLWFGGNKDGITIFDGHNVYSVNEDNGLDAQLVSVLYEDKNHNVWVGTREKGLFCITKNKVIDYSEKCPLKWVRSIYEDTNGDLLISGDSVSGELLFRYSNKAFLPIAVPLNDIRTVSTLLRDKNKNLWLGTEKGPLCLTKDSIMDFRDLDNFGYLVKSITQTREGIIWFGTEGAGASYYQEGHFYQVSVKSGLPSRNAFTIFHDADITWIGTFNEGLVRYKKNPFKNYDFVRALYTVEALDSNRYFFGTWANGAYIYNPKVDTFIYSPPTQSKDYIASGRDSKGRLWVGTWNGGIGYYENGIYRHFYRFGGKTSIKCFEETGDGDIWVGTWFNGLYKISGKTIKPILKTQFQRAEIHDIKCSNDNEVWVATNKGLFIYRDKKVVKTNYIPIYVRINCLEIDSKGSVWIGTANQGIFKIETSNRVINYTDIHGLSNNNVTVIKEDSRGEIWVGTANGINYFNDTLNVNQNDSHVFRPFGLNEGFMGISCTGAVWEDYEHNIWWGTQQNFVKMNPRIVLKKPKPPTVFIEDIKIHHKTINWVELMEQRNNDSIHIRDFSKYDYLPTGLNLEASQNHLMFVFRVLTNSNSEKIEFQYYLENHDEKWSEWSKLNQAVFTNVEPGEHVLYVRARDEFGQLSGDIIYRFNVAPAFWQTWWFNVIMVLVLTAIIFVLYFLRIISYKRRQKKLEYEVSRRTLLVERQKEVLKQSNEQITSSIKAAKRLQKAIIPNLSHIKKYIPEASIFYKPKSILSGDFYWVNARSNTVFVAAADCTGHGIQGAMLSLICYNALNSAVNDMRIYSPSDILDAVRDIVIGRFENSESLIEDGMDISLLAFNKSTLEAEWAGAFNPLWIVRDGELIKIKGDRQSVGFTSNYQPFTSHSVSLQPNDIIFLFSDGYADQFGGPYEEKYGRKKFGLFLQDLAAHPINEHEQLLNEEFVDWKRNQEQIDDICVMSFKI